MNRQEVSDALATPHTYADRALYHSIATRLRAEEPIFWAESQSSRPFWAISKHADVMQIERQPELFKNGPRLQLMSTKQEQRLIEATNGRPAAQRTMLQMDGSEHRAYRGMVQSWFMPGNLRKMENDLAALAKEYVDDLAAAGGETDFVKTVSELFPLRVILMILGLSGDEVRTVLELTRNFTDVADTEVPEGMSQEDLLLRAVQGYFEYFAPIFEERRQNPRDDVASVIACAEIDGKPINRLEALSHYMLLGLAGHDTTNGSISGGLLAFIENPGEMARLKADPGLISTAVDEILRWVSPVNSFLRTATQDYVLHDKTIRAGDSVLLLFGSANRDEEVFDEPFTFRIDRKPNPQISFGYGPHVCLGQHLAKMELRALFKELIPRLASVALSGTPRMTAHATANQFVSLPIRYRLETWDLAEALA